MKLLETVYRARGRPVPYYARYPLWLLLWKPVRKVLNVVVIPNIPLNSLRILLYRLVGYRIGRSVFIGMKCYLDDIEPRNTVIGDGVIISHGCYFVLHGRGQSWSHITIEAGAYIGMRSTLVARAEPLTVGADAIVGAGSLVLNNVVARTTVAGHPARRLHADETERGEVDENGRAGEQGAARAPS
ncbi:MAG: acyltransferase [Bacteroidota bacterium]